MGTLSFYRHLQGNIDVSLNPRLKNGRLDFQYHFSNLWDMEVFFWAATDILPQNLNYN